MNKEFAPHPLSRTISSTDFANWGLPEIAFIKRVQTDGEIGWAIHAADGTPMGLASSREIAFAAVTQHELEPVSVH
ncbi:conserved hypothetical protein [Magnetospirillum sp. LM-5]|uniref:DUF1150 family protein n=1 Tax=Magnetospirillum sp. LM-5 TaxID=2681466 RepID=UPI00137DD1CD|nr:DUF1150 family protein [Magnetospirillum sp. LM-5]CAA7617471.1 conserved hypothetical protein [Magnetospirillum sp. LM-5]